LNVLDQFFPIWFERYSSIQDFAEATEFVEQNAVHYMQLKAFREWHRLFILSSYLRQKQQELTEFSTETKLRRYFGNWWINFSDAQRCNDLLQFAVEEVELGTMNRFLERWKSLYQSHSYSRSQLTRAGSRLRSFAVRRLFWQWLGRFHCRRALRGLYEKAGYFRRTCLQLKGMNSIKGFVKFRREKWRQIAACRAVCVKFIEKLRFSMWRGRSSKYRRRTLLVRAVLRNWASEVEHRALNRWGTFVCYRREKKENEAVAIKRNGQIQLAMLLRAFVKGAPAFGPTATPPNASLVVETDLKELSRPKRPSFLGNAARPAVVNSTGRIRALEDELQKLISDLNLNGSNEEQRKRLLSLIREINEFRRVALDP
jgi:hypothetical protein